MKFTEEERSDTGVDECNRSLSTHSSVRHQRSSLQNKKHLHCTLAKLECVSSATLVAVEQRASRRAHFLGKFVSNFHEKITLNQLAHHEKTQIP